MRLNRALQGSVGACTRARASPLETSCTSSSSLKSTSVSSASVAETIRVSPRSARLREKKSMRRFDPPSAAGCIECPCLRVCEPRRQQTLRCPPPLGNYNDAQTENEYTTRPPHARSARRAGDRCGSRPTPGRCPRREAALPARASRALSSRRCGCRKKTGTKCMGVDGVRGRSSVKIRRFALLR